MISGLWYAIETRRGYELLGAKILRSKGYLTFAPLYRKRKVGDHPAEVDIPLFENYLFVQIPREARAPCGPIVTTPGVKRIVSFGGVAAVVPDSEIETIRDLVNSGICLEPWKWIPSGSVITIESGPMKGVEGVLISAPTEQRIVVSIQILQRSVTAILDTDTVYTVLKSGRGETRAERLAVTLTQR